MWLFGSYSAHKCGFLEILLDTTDLVLRPRLLYHNMINIFNLPFRYLSKTLFLFKSLRLQPQVRTQKPISSKLLILQKYNRLLKSDCFLQKQNYCYAR